MPVDSSDPEPIEYLFYPAGHCLGRPPTAPHHQAHCAPTPYPLVPSDASVSYVQETLRMGGTPSYPAPPQLPMPFGTAPPPVPFGPLLTFPPAPIHHIIPCGLAQSP